MKVLTLTFSIYAVIVITFLFQMNMTTHLQEAKKELKCIKSEHEISYTYVGI